MVKTTPRMSHKALILAAGLLIASQSVSGAECGDLIRTERLGMDRSGVAVCRVSLTASAANNPTDSVIVELGRCYTEIISSFLGPAVVEDEAGRRIDMEGAREMGEY